MNIVIGDIKCAYSNKGCDGSLLPVGKVEKSYGSGLFSISVSSSNNAFDQWKCNICGHTIFRTGDKDCFDRQVICNCLFCIKNIKKERPIDESSESDIAYAVGELKKEIHTLS